jgi:thiol:disulfide interchange protein DsbD
MRRRAAAILLALAAAGASRASAEGAFAEAAFDAGDARIEARLLVHSERTADGSLRAGVLFTLDPGWHLYWKQPGDAGLPTRLEWRDAEAGPVAWPAPRVFEEGGGTLVTYGYADSVLLASEVRPHAGARALAVEVDALACRTECIPARFSLERPLEAADSGETADAVRRLFALHDEALPEPVEAFGVTLEARAVDPLHFALVLEPCVAADRPCRALAAPAFAPAHAGLRVLDARDAGGRIELLLAREADAPAALEGVLSLVAADGRVHALEVAVADAGAAPIDWTALASALALGVLGGLLLNLMPCVLPVLALKAFAVAELAGRGRREALAQGAAYTAGILLSMLALASVVLLLRAAGREVGWGFQLQAPGFVVLVAALCTAFALNLLGVFEISFVPGGLADVGADASGARRSFLEGLLAVALATPCSAPFLGTAVGFAFAGPGASVLAVFFAIGLGLAAPFAVICAFPAARGLLPRPGPWMRELRSVLGFALLATVVWLAWVLGRSAGIDALAALLALLLAVAIAAWTFGRVERQRPRGLVLALAVALVAVGSNQVSVAPQREPASESQHAAWRPEELARLRSAGRPVVVVFTADWCLTCKWNERTVLASDEVGAALARGGFAVLRADWTRRDEAIRRELARFGRAGVPLTLVYRAGAEQPELLPELLTVEAMLAALEPDEGRPARGDRAADGSRTRRES